MVGFFAKWSFRGSASISHKNNILKTVKNGRQFTAFSRNSRQYLTIFDNEYDWFDSNPFILQIAKPKGRSIDTKIYLHNLDSFFETITT